MNHVISLETDTRVLKKNSALSRKYTSKRNKHSWMNWGKLCLFKTTIFIFLFFFVIFTFLFYYLFFVSTFYKCACGYRAHKSLRPCIISPVFCKISQYITLWYKLYCISVLSLIDTSMLDKFKSGLLKKPFWFKSMLAILKFVFSKWLKATNKRNLSLI